MAKPADFYVGAIDLFAVLLPGAVAAGALAVLVPMPHLLEPLLASRGAQWIAFALASYAFGHFVFLVASYADNLLYDPQASRGRAGKDHAYLDATELRHRFFGTDESAGGDVPMNTFTWAKTVLALRAPVALADVQRYEADSKFFRSMMVILPPASLAVLVERGSCVTVFGTIGAACILSILCYRRYAERRFKSTEWAYFYLLTLLRLDGLGEVPDHALPTQKPL
jgi:hypothetical protein